MKKLLSLIAIFSIATAIPVSGQNSLSKSRRGSPEIFVYKLNEKDVRDLYLKDKDLDESMLHTLVLRIPGLKDIPELPRGNYITVRAFENKLEYDDHTVDSFYHNTVDGEKVMLYLCDTLGNVIDDAVVKRGLKRLRYDPATQTYNTRRVGDEKIVEVNNNGVLHFIEFENFGSDYARTNFFQRSWWKIKNGFNRIFMPDRAPLRYKYNGFVVFSKPKYKPGEVVRFKAYINVKGRSYDDEAEVSLVSSYTYPARMDTTLTTLRPYRPGMYEWSFRLSDSLKMSLDGDYQIVLKTRGEMTNDISGSFRYEEYELGRITFSAKADKKKYAKGEAVNLHFDAKDENRMPVYDGRVDITIRSAPDMNMSRKYYSNSAFIPDEIWTHTLDLAGKGSEKLTLPDSVFVPGVAMHYDIECSFLDAGNEKQSEAFSVYMDMRDRVIDFAVDKGIITVREVADGESVAAKALLTAYNEDGYITYRDSVMLPHSFPLMWTATDYEVETATAYEDLYVDEIYENIMGYRFFREDGNVRLIVDNPAGFPFWYTVRKGGIIIDKGYASQLDRSYRERGKNGYTMQLSYMLGEDETRIIRGNLPYFEKNISMEVNTATTVYPGQTSTVDVLVRDKKGRPVKDADVTAWAATSKFGSHLPHITIFGKSKYGKGFNNDEYDTYEDSWYNAKAPMEWSVWRERMGLDSIEYYKFLYPEISYSNTEKVPDGITQIAPYVVIDGALQGVHILWIDEQPHYFYGAQQMDVYSFPVVPGFHTLRFRTYDREITVENVYVEAGAKTIVSINGKSSTVSNAVYGMEDKPLRITVNEYDKKSRGILSERDMNTLKGHMITVDNTFGSVRFPNDNSEVMPAMINSSGVYYYLNEPGKQMTYYPRLAGPFPYRGFSTGGKKIGSLYLDTTFVANFEIEGGYRYSIWNNLLKQTGWDQSPINNRIAQFTPTVSFDRNALTAAGIRKTYRDRLMSSIEGMTGILLPVEMDDTDGCRLRLEVGGFRDSQTQVKPAMIRLSGSGERDSLEYIYGGKERQFDGLPEGDYNIDLIFRDSTRYRIPTTLRKGGLNYLKVDSIAPVPADSIGRKAFEMLRSGLRVSIPSNPVADFKPHEWDEELVSVPAHAVGRLEKANLDANIITGVVLDDHGYPIIGAMVTIEGTETGALTDTVGRFTLPYAGSGKNLVVSYLGYEPFSTRFTPGYDYKIVLEASVLAMDEVVVAGYYGIRREERSLSYNVITVEENFVWDLEGRAAGVSIASVRGTSSVSDARPPLIVIDGVPYDGALSDLDTADIASINVLKDASNVAIYGARAAHGVIFINTKSGAVQDGSEIPDDRSNAKSLRTNFHDDAFWRPRLSTDSNGSVTFEVTWPDDITSWDANFIAVGGRKQTDRASLNIRSFKPLNAQLSLPQFAVLGDSTNVIGRLTNHLGDSVTVRRSIELQGRSYEKNLSLSESHVDNIPVTVVEPDSLGITYSLAMDNGYFDGERRMIPVYKVGVLESHGEFAVLGDTANTTIQTNPALGEVTVHAETSSIQSFLDEIDKIDRYPYLCNEQMASKIKALLLKKRLYSMSGRTFGDDGKIKNLIGRLENNSNSDNLWGWWNRDKTELWISKQVVEAMLDAEAAGYKTGFDKTAATDVLISELHRRLSSTGNKHELLDILRLLKKLDAKIDYTQYITLVSSLPDSSLNDRLRCMEMAHMFGVADSLRAESLLGLASETMMGAMYWSEKEKPEIEPGRFLRPDINNTDNTLTAYRLLREIGGHEKELERIRNYFFEMRKSGSWPNTYESSRIMETIMPDMLDPEGGFSDAVLTVNGRRFEKFPVTEIFPASETIEVKKEGSVPVFFTVYQQAWNNEPERTSKGFSIETAFYRDNETTALLQAGKSVDLRVSVTVDSDAQYVMIEVPIPAGCSYESKVRGNSWRETHREYHKEKVVIFCNRLSGGTHEFTINLLPRYTGSYHLNPAKAELMYYPTIFGRENMKMSEIR